MSVNEAAGRLSRTASSATPVGRNRAMSTSAASHQSSIQPSSSKFPSSTSSPVDSRYRFSSSSAAAAANGPHQYPSHSTSSSRSYHPDQIPIHPQNMPGPPIGFPRFAPHPMQFGMYPGPPMQMDGWGAIPGYGGPPPHWISGPVSMNPMGPPIHSSHPGGHPGWYSIRPVSPRSMSMRDRDGRLFRSRGKDRSDREEGEKCDVIELYERGEDESGIPSQMAASSENRSPHGRRTLSQQATSFTPSTPFVKSTTPTLSRTISMTSSSVSNYSMLAEGALKIVMDSDGDDESVENLLGEKNDIEQINVLGLRSFEPFARTATSTISKGDDQFVKFNKVAEEIPKNKAVEGILESREMKDETKSTVPSYAQITGTSNGVQLDQYKPGWKELKDHMDQFWDTVVTDLSIPYESTAPRSSIDSAIQPRTTDMHPALDSTAISSNTPPTTESHKLNLRVPQTSASMLSISSMSPAISDTQMTAEVMMNALPPPPPIGTSFAVILLDGDSTLFHHDLVKRGAAGGRDAAYSLSTAVYELCSAMMPVEERPQCFMVQIMINKTAVGERLVSNGVIPSTRVYEDFCLGFSKTHDLFTFVDVESRASSAAKIREHLRLFANITAAKVILIGSAKHHDYIPLLEGFQTHGQMHKIFLARSTEELNDDPFLKFGQDKLFAIPGLFILPGEVTCYSGGDEFDDDQGRTEFADLEEVDTDDAGDINQVTSQMQTSLDFGQRTSNVMNITLDDSVNDQSILKRKKRGGSMVTQSSKQITSINTEWMTIMDGKKKLKGRKATARDPFEQSDYSSMKGLNPRPCHKYYLINRCDNKKCSYGHDYQLTDKELAAVKTLAKEMLCPEHKNGKCKKSQDSCMYGHLCPRGSACTFGSECWFTCTQGYHTVDGRSLRIKVKQENR